MIRPPAVAGYVSYSVDDKGMLWLRAFDVNGYLVCVCMFSEEGARQLAGYIYENYNEHDEIGEVAGHA